MRKNGENSKNPNVSQKYMHIVQETNMNYKRKMAILSLKIGADFE